MLRIVIHFSATEIEKHNSQDFAATMDRYFDYRVGIINRDI